MYREEGKQVTITLRSLETANTEDGLEELKDVKQYQGIRYEKGEKTYLKYEETQEDVVITSIIVISPDEVIIRRTGGTQSRLQFRSQLQYSFLYHTAYGDVPLTIRTRELDAERMEDAIHIQISYDILSQDVVVSYHEISLDVE